MSLRIILHPQRLGGLRRLVTQGCEDGPPHQQTDP
jgi:hypothetical protein